MSRMSQWSMALAAAGALAITGAVAASAQGVTLPPSGGNQRASVTQGIGLVRVTIDYSSPRVHTAAGDDRRGKIWGDKNLVPYGMSKLGGSCDPECPWRGGANENTVFTTNETIQVQGQTLPAGSYGVHFVPGPQEWTIIFSKNSTSWGSFSYDAKEDALRVTAKPAKSEYHEDLTYGFRDRQTDHATAVLQWEDLELPFAITVPNSNDLYVASLKRELRSTGGFSWQGYNAAALFCLQNKTHLEDGLKFAELAVSPTVGAINFSTLTTLSSLQEANGKADEAKKSRLRALHEGNPTVLELHQYARQLLAQKKTEEAVEAFQLNAKLHPDSWVVHVGLGRAYAATGRRKEAIEQFKLATPPDDLNRNNLKDMIAKLEAGKDI